MSVKQPKPVPLQPVQETIYIDCNREHSITNDSEETNSWKYKLNQPLYLPKGTAISLDNTFINLKGITGGSIEIEEDILERVDFGYYITENPHFAPIASYSGNTYEKNQMRSTLAVSIDGWSKIFNTAGSGGYYGANLGADDVRSWWAGEAFDTNYNLPNGTYDAISLDDFQTNHYPYFNATGGCEVPLIAQRLTNIGGDEYLQPITGSVVILIKKGIYGVSQLAQNIEDFFNGQLLVVDENGSPILGDEPFTNKLKVLTRTDFENRMMQGLGNLNAQVSRENFVGDGMPINLPLVKKIFTLTERRNNPFNDGFKRQEDGIELNDCNVFTIMDTFRKSMSILEPIQQNGSQHTYANAVAGVQISADDQTLFYNNTQLSRIRGGGGAKSQPLYAFIPNWDSGGDYTDDAGANHDKGARDDDVSCATYNIGTGYALATADTGDITQLEFCRYVGTTNFQFKYNTDTNGYEIIGLHNQVVGASHDTQGNSNTNAGKQIIRFRKVKNSWRTLKSYKNFNGAGVSANGNPNKSQRTFDARRIKLIKAMNRPETRNSGIMIFNWARRTCESEGDLIRDNPVDYPSMGKYTRFHRFYQSERTARKAWKKTLWFRLGFTYDQLCNQNNYDTTPVWDVPHAGFGSNNYTEGRTLDGQDYGFTTNTKIDNSYFQTVATLNNPLSVKNPSAGSSKMGGVQVGSLVATASTNLGLDTANAQARMFSNSLYRESLTYEVEIDDVGGVKANNLPQLTKHSYFLITSDILDSYKDNVKAGDPMPLLGVVPKTNLSSQDFIVAQNQIVQTSTMDKLVNSIKITVLNPNLTAPTLDPFSSVILKIIRPNVIPPSLQIDPPPPESPVDATDLDNE